MDVDAMDVDVIDDDETRDEFDSLLSLPKYQYSYKNFFYSAFPEIHPMIQ